MGIFGKMLGVKQSDLIKAAAGEVDVDSKEGKRLWEELKKPEVVNKPFGTEEHKQWYYLLHACRYSPGYQIEQLRECGADAKVVDENGKSALYWLGLNTHEKYLSDEVGPLVRAGADVSRRSTEGRTACWAAAKRGNRGVLEALLEHKADPNLADNDGYSPLHIACMNSDNPQAASECVNLLLDNGAAARVLNKIGMTPLQALAACQGAFGKKSVCAIAERLLNAGVAVNAQTPDGETACLLAAGKGNYPLLEMLLEHGADPNIIKKDDISPLHVACLCENDDDSEKSVRVLLDHGANPNAIIKSVGASTLFGAAETDRPAVAEMLVKAGADLSIKDVNGCTALDFAADKGAQKVVNFLCAQGAPYDPQRTKIAGEIEMKVKWDTDTKAS